MAERPKEDVAEGQDPQAQQVQEDDQGSKKKLIIVVASSVLLIGLVVTTALLLMGDEKSGSQNTQATKSNDADEPIAQKSESSQALETPKFYSIRPAFIVNIPSQGRIRYLQIEVDIMTRQDKVVSDLEAYGPLIKNELVQLFSNQDYETLQAPEGREKLRQEALMRVQTVMRDQAGVEDIEQVLFTRFVTQ